MKSSVVPFVMLGAALACSSQRASHREPTPVAPPPAAASAPANVAESLNQAQAQQLNVLAQQLDASRRLGGAEVLAKRNVKFLEQLSYDPLKSQYLDRIQASSLGLDKKELEKLAQHGFVISSRQGNATFLRGYAAIYSEDLPVYISADAILEAVHTSYDQILSMTERSALVGLLDRLLSNMHNALPKASNDFDPKVIADVDGYLSVARSLLQGTMLSGQAGAEQASVEKLVNLATAANGIAEVPLFGPPRDLDMSQFIPRGHYDDGAELSRYFRTMIWLGRVEMRLLETLPNGQQKFRRPQYEAMLLLRRLMSNAELETWQKLDSAVRAFVGESDSMIVSQVDMLQQDLGGEAAALAASDAAVEAAIRAGGYGSQHIASQLSANSGEVKTLPLDRSFLLFGQRYVLDSHVFSQVVFDRLPNRLMPNPLDAAFAAMGNDQAVDLLGAQLDATEYAGALDAARVLADAHPSDFWGRNLYNSWLGALRSLSPASDMTQRGEHHLPDVMNTRAWGQRILNTQLASWAELRHDTLLYAKQSYSGIPLCEYPAAYIDPYPEFFARLRRFADNGVALAKTLEHDLGADGTRVIEYFDHLAKTMTTLQGMAQNELEGKELSAEQLAFVNDAVRIVQDHAGCATINTPDGWLADLYFERESSIHLSPTVADVHTQPADKHGNIVGHVLHVATGYPRLMVVTQNGCGTPRAYAGIVFAYHERITKNFDRLTDERWTQDLATKPQPDVAWMRSIVAP